MGAAWRGAFAVRDARLAMLATYLAGDLLRLRFAGRAMGLHACCFDALAAHMRTAAHATSRLPSFLRAKGEASIIFGQRATRGNSSRKP
jgi:hypothetical protein